MFNKNKFALIIKNISETYISQRSFSEKSGINRTYLSQYMNMKLDSPPTPRILQKLADNSHGITTYNDLMEICGYLDTSPSSRLQCLKVEQEEYLEQFSEDLDKVRLSEKNEEIYEDLISIIPIHDFINYSYEKINKELDSYFENMNYIDKSSQKKIKNKIKIFISQQIKLHNISEEIVKCEFQIENIETKYSYKNKFYMCPVYGQIFAGVPNWAEERIIGYIPLDVELMDIHNHEECFFLKVNR